MNEFKEDYTLLLEYKKSKEELVNSVKDEFIRNAKLFFLRNPDIEYIIVRINNYDFNDGEETSFYLYYDSYLTIKFNNEKEKDIEILIQYDSSYKSDFTELQHSKAKEFSEYMTLYRDLYEDFFKDRYTPIKLSLDGIE